MLKKKIEKKKSQYYIETNICTNEKIYNESTEVI